jgi:hypothetical protein
VICCLLIINIPTKNIRLFHPFLFSGPLGPERVYDLSYFTYLSLLTITFHPKRSSYFVINWQPHSQRWLVSPCLPRCNILFFCSHRHLCYLVYFLFSGNYSLLGSTLLVMIFQVHFYCFCSICYNIFPFCCRRFKNTVCWHKWLLTPTSCGPQS